MNMKNRMTIFVITILIILIIFSAVLGNVISDHICGFITELYEGEFVISEDMVFDEPEIIGQYRREIVIKKGDKGKIKDWMTYPYDLKGYEYIEATVAGAKVAISFDHGEEIAIYRATEINYHAHDDYIIVFDADKIEVPESVIEGYKQRHKKFTSRITKAKVTSISICVGIALVISVIVLLAYHHQNKNYYN